MMDITLYIYIVHNKALTSLDIDKNIWWKIVICLEKYLCVDICWKQFFYFCGSFWVSYSNPIYKEVQYGQSGQ